MSEPSKSFSLRLSPEDHVRLEQVAARFALDRTGALRYRLVGNDALTVGAVARQVADE